MSLAEEYVNFLAANAVPKGMTLDEVQSATKQDKTLQCVSWLVRSQQWHKIDNLLMEHQEADHAELKSFRKMKENADRSRRASPLTLKRGDIVLVRQRKHNKFTTRFDPRPFEVVRKKGTMITAY